MPERKVFMFSKYEIGDTVILKGTIREIKQTHDGTVLYRLGETETPVGENDIIGKVEAPWALVNTGT